MKILSVDTALGACSAAVLDGERILARAHEPMQRGHAERLAPMVESVMREAGIAFAALDRLGVTTGPGTFTGQRVGIAFIRALALAVKIPAIGVTTLDAMCAEALASSDPSLAICVSDARRGEVYFGVRDRSGRTLIEASLLPLDEAVERVVRLDKVGIVLAGTAAEQCQALLSGKTIASTDSGIRQPDAVFVARIAQDRTAAGPPRPLYLREPDAKLPSAI